MQKGLILALWAVAAALVLLLVALPISLQTHLIAGLLVVASMIVLKFFRAQGIWRMIALSLGTAIVLRYVYWRTTNTLPPLSELMNYIPAILLYLAEMYSVLWTFSSRATTKTPTSSRRRSPPQRAWPTRRTS